MHKNENRPGYKKTKVGWIPEEWRATTVGGIVDDKTIAKPLDGNHGNIHPKADDFVASGIPFVMAKDVQNGIVNVDNCACITREQADSLQKGFSKKGDVLLTHKATVGNTAIVGEIKTDYIMLTPQVTYYRVLDKKRLNNRYLRHYLDCCQFQEILSVLAGGGTRSYIGITAQRKLPICYPLLPEQEAIAEVLECWDKGIRTLENKIVKKRRIKKGLMQKLLSGQIRLPGFSKHWKNVRLGNVARIKTGKKDVNQGNPSGKYPFFTCAKTHTYSDDYSFDTEAILIAGNGEVGHCLYYSGKFEAYQRTYVLHDFKAIDALYLFSCLRHRFQAQVEQQKQMGAMPYIKLEMLTEFELHLPPIEEQQAIAEVLTAADGELEALERKLALWKDQKKFLLNNLVTGTLRLPEFKN